MRKLLLYFLLLLFYQVKAQHSQALPPSPEAASLSKYAEFPVSYFAGLPQINLPLYEIKINELTIPISLSYHGGGIQASEEASRVGLGWTLNAGGAIIRTVKGLPDESKNGKKTGEIIGRSLTEYSFLNENGAAVEGAIIDPSDKSGMNFVSNEIIKEDPNILFYMPNAIRKGDYNFKRVGEPEKLTHDKQLKYYYRGMPFNNSGTYASARDIGNWGAGYIAGKSGLSWGIARIGFDGLESLQHIRKGQIDWYREGAPTQQAERAGYQVGQMIFNLRLMKMLTNFIK